MCTNPSSRRTIPTIATPTPMISCDGRTSSTASSRTTRTRSSGPPGSGLRSPMSVASAGSCCPAGVAARHIRSTRRCSWIRPPGPTVATVTESTAISTASVTSRSVRTPTIGDGRPRVPRRSASPSTTRPRAASRSTSALMVLRFRSVLAASSERESGPPRCSWRSTTLRLCRRTASCVEPCSIRTGHTVFDMLTTNYVEPSPRSRSASRWGAPSNAGRDAT